MFLGTQLLVLWLPQALSLSVYLATCLVNLQLWFALWLVVEYFQGRTDGVTVRKDVDRLSVHIGRGICHAISLEHWDRKGCGLVLVPIFTLQLFQILSLSAAGVDILAYIYQSVVSLLFQNKLKLVCHKESFVCRGLKSVVA